MNYDARQMQNTNQLIEPYGGSLVNLVSPREEAAGLLQRASSLPRLQLSERSACDLELLATGGFSPLKTFMGRDDYEHVIEEMRLANGVLFPIPVTLTIRKNAQIKLDAEIALADSYNNLLAILRVDEIYNWDRAREAELVCGTTDPRHPLVAEMNSWGDACISGALEVLQPPPRYDFRTLRMEPAEVRRRLELIGRRNVVAFQTRNPLHRAHEEMTKRAMESVDGTLLLHPVVGMTKPGDIDHYTRVRSYRALTELYYDQDRALLAVLPLAMRMAGPREALWHAIIRRNFGANHFIVGRDHASPGTNSKGLPFYEPYAAQQLLSEHSAETGITSLPFAEFLYLPERDRYEEASRIPVGTSTIALSGTEVRETYLQQGRSLPDWFIRPEVSAILESSHPPRHRQGFCLWFTGLSCAGKTTTANIVTTKLMEHGRRITLLDGDVVRTHLSRGLDFSKEDRDTNIRRIGFVAAEVVRHGGAVICAAVSPYKATRDECRSLVAKDRFIEVFVDTPIEICEARDQKGNYARARAGEIENFTGINDPYEPPTDAEITIDGVIRSGEENADFVLAYLIEQGFILNDFALDNTVESRHQLQPDLSTAVLCN
ncbi:MAG TPA: bifunctional sulfate adenylyltransferase/adenylylsulfate kinase [Pyrinomonadaceae bacterium]|nr:bifunctional sulfate adenylyltransferase/adenylylsulfate kinase [Pyrinomonadaceae bacterium]